MSTPPLHVVILAAGKGSRMRSNTPKVLHCIGGQSLVGHVVNSASQLAPQCIHVVVGHGKEQVMTELQQHESASILNFVVQEQQLGTGDAVNQALPHIPEDANVLMLTADVPLIQSGTLKSLVNSMQSHTLTVLTADVDEPYGLGRITRDSTQAVSGIVEEKDASAEQKKITEINSGIICARKAPLDKWLAKIGNDNNQREYYLTDVVGIAYDSGEPITTLKATDNQEINGINDRIQLASAERSYQKHRAETMMLNGVTIIDPDRIDIRGEVAIGADTTIDINVVIEGDTVIADNVRIGPNCVISNSQIGPNVQIHANTVIENAVVGANSQLGPFARLRPGTELEDGVKIGNFVETKNAKLSSGAKINHLSYVGDASVGKNTNIGAGVITCNYDGANKHHTSIGENVFVGSDCQLVAPVTIEDGATIGAGSTITNDVSANMLAISRGKQREINGWQRPTKKKK